MKRTMALWAAVPVFCVAMGTARVAAQTPPATAPGDTLRPGSAAPPPASTVTTPPGRPTAPGAPTAAPAPADTMTAAQRIRRAQASTMSYVISLGVGTSINQAPDAFTSEFDPSFGFYIDGGVRRWELELTLSFDYNFFFTNRQQPEDLNVANLFLNLKYRPLKTTARPYVLGCAGWFRSWIVDELDPTSPPRTFVHEVEAGDNKYEENVLGFGVGGGVEIEMDKTRRIFFEGRYIEGRTRETEERANLVIIPFRVGLTWEF